MNNTQSAKANRLANPPQRRTARSSVAAAETITILPGWTYTTQKWQPFIKEFEKQGCKSKILPIPGLTAPLNEPWTLNDYVKFVRSKVDKPTILIGHSNGGRLALAFSAQYPTLVKKLILIDSAGIRSTNLVSKLKRFVFRLTAKIGKLILPFSFCRRLLYQLAREKDYFEASSVMRQTMVNLLSVDLTPILSSITAPTTIIWGQQDQVTPLAGAQKIHSLIRNSTLHIITGARHSPQFTHPEAVVAIITPVIQSQPQPNALEAPPDPNQVKPARINIFNSLGSNYSASSIWQALTNSNHPDHSRQLTRYLEHRYQGQAVLLYKNREALRLGLELAHLPKGSCVGITGFTCFVVDQAVIAAGHRPEYLDIDLGTLNFTAQTLESKAKQNPHLKAVVVQNTLGYPGDIKAIRSVCQKYQLTLIEDLAHSAGGSYKTGEEIGTVGDLTVLSFSQDKIIDAVSGGALIIRNPKINLPPIKFSSFGLYRQAQDRWYPFLASSIRWLYPIKLGKYWHAFLKTFRILSMPINPEDIVFRPLPHWQAKLAFDYLSELNQDLCNRRQIAQVYAQELDPKLISKNLTPQIPHATNLRFPLFVPMRHKLIKFLKHHGIYISDIWYDTPISPIDVCPNSETIAHTIINLPTHRHVSVSTARHICYYINQWFKSL